MAAEPPGRHAHGATPTLRLQLQWRPYRFELPRALVTSQGAWSLQRGWLLRLEAADGRLGWGEAAIPPVAAMAGGEGMATGALSDGSVAAGNPASRTGATADIQPEAAAALPTALERRELEARLPGLPAPLACALGMALAELDGLGSAEQGGWLTAPASAHLLPAGEAAVTALEQALAGVPQDRTLDGEAATFTVKWKVASSDDGLERRVLDALLERLPSGARLRLDANGGWDRTTAWRWAERLAGEPRLEWLEQPLDPADRDGLEALAGRLPVALDESLRRDPALIAGGWRGWQVRRPLVEGDPRPLLAALRAGTPRLMLSTALETGIGRRFLRHLAGLQALGPTPTAPGLAPGWRPRGELFSLQPETVWGAAG